MSMKTVVFMVNTEYHLLLSLGILRTCHTANYKTYIYKVAPIGGSRLKQISFEHSDIEYREIVYNYDHPNRNLRERIKEIVNLNPSVFYFFLENKYWLNFLLSSLHNKGTKIVLGPDGLKAYNDSRVSYLKIIKNTAKGLLGCLKSGIFYPPLVEKTYATSKYIDEVWVDCPSKYKNRSNKRVVGFQIPYGTDFISELNSIFMVKNKDLSNMNGKTILFIDSPYSSEKYYEITTKLINEVQRRCPERRLNIKLHQLSSNKAKLKYQLLKDATFLEKQCPAELYIANAQDCIVISLISTSLLFYNPKCRYYWTYPLYQDLYDYSKIINPTHHIQVISKLEEIVSNE